MSLIVNSQLSGSGRPESVFIAWLLWQPRDADLAVEAIKELNRLAPYEDGNPDVVRLRSLFECLAGRTAKLH